MHQESDLGCPIATKTSQPYGKARDCQSKRSYPNPFSIEAYRREWEKDEKEVKDLQMTAKPKKTNVPLDLEYQLFKRR